MAGPSKLTSVVNFCINGAVRIPSLSFGAFAGLGLGEAGQRVLSTVAGLIGIKIKLLDMVRPAVEKMPSGAGDVLSKVQLRPFKDLSHKELACVTLGLSVASVLGMEFSNWACGKIPAIYNKALNWVGPLEFNKKWRHPLVERFVGPYKDKPEEIK